MIPWSGWRFSGAVFPVALAGGYLCVFFQWEGLLEGWGAGTPPWSCRIFPNTWSLQQGSLLQDSQGTKVEVARTSQGLPWDLAQGLFYHSSFTKGRSQTALWHCGLQRICKDTNTSIIVQVGGLGSGHSCHRQSHVPILPGLPPVFSRAAGHLALHVKPPSV